MKVMHLSSGFSSSGVTAGLMCLVKNRFYDNFDDFRIVGTELGDPQIFKNFSDIMKPGQVRFIEVDKSEISSSRFTQSIRAIRSYIDEFAPDALILSTSSPVIQGRLAAHHYPNLKVVTFEHHTLAHLPEKKKQALRWTSSANHVIWGDAPGTLDITKNTLYNAGAESMPTFVVPLTIPDFSPPRISQDVQKFEVLSLGRLDTEKNYFELIHAVSILAKAGYDFHLTIAGKGKQHKPLQKLAEELGVSDRVTLPGYVGNPGPLRAKSHIYIQPSLSEGLCIGFIEAAAAGMVIVGTDVGGMKDYGVDNHNMIKIQGFDRDAIAEALQRAFDSYSDNACALSENAIHTAAEHFGERVVKRTWKVAADALRELCFPPSQIVNLKASVVSAPIIRGQPLDTYDVS